ncbi:MAG: hypothetical protein GQ477_01850 [Nanohaloarchaea archaeon]|nr:hypothetical protein [Candidatus Nanohaloarchaea archaeon]
MIIDLIVSIVFGIRSLFQTKRHKGEVDALMIALAGVLILAILALVFVMTVGTSLDASVDMICKYKADAIGKSGEAIADILGVC